MSNDFVLDAIELREVLSALPDVAAQESLEPPALNTVYIPKGHMKALSLDTSIVVGMRGAGKSLWTAVLASTAHRTLVTHLSDNPWRSNPYVCVGYGLDMSGKRFPSESTLETLLQENYDPVVIWQTVVLRHALIICGIESPLPNGWREAIAWCARETEMVAHLLNNCDQKLAEQGRPLLILFDALERLAPEWPAIRKLLIGALRVCLQCRSRRMIRLKFFIRPDMEEDPEIWEFRDSSKLKSSKVELLWGKADLYGLIFYLVANSSTFGKQFRQSIFPLFWEEHEGVFFVPDDLIRNESLQEKIVSQITGLYMGTNKRRGYTYRWIPTHLADAVGRVSPRSFLLAFKGAADKTKEIYPTHKFSLHYEAILQGVVHASKTRVNEIKEDYPWIKPILEVCRGLIVPIDIAEFTQSWNEEMFQLIRKEGEKKLLPRRFSFDPLRSGKNEALLDDLVELAVIYRTENDRINMPDIFRVEFGIKRRGGVKPPR